MKWTSGAWTGLTAQCSKLSLPSSMGARWALSTLAIAVGEEPETVETVAEPFLVREGLLGRTPRGRIAMASAWTHLGYAVPSGVFGQETLALFGEDENHAESVDTIG
jgi:Holliday junction DNA helicase RuvB